MFVNVEKDMKALERELATMRGFAACRGDDNCLDEADAELAQLRNIEEAAKLACGLLWMMDSNDDTGRGAKPQAAFEALRDAIGGSGSKGLGEAIKRAIDAGYEADHPPGTDWWAGKKMACDCGNPDCLGESVQSDG